MIFHMCDVFIDGLIECGEKCRDVGKFVFTDLVILLRYKLGPLVCLSVCLLPRFLPPRATRQRKRDIKRLTGVTATPA